MFARPAHLALIAFITLAASPLFAQEDAAKLETSLKSWQQAKAQCKGNYTYQVRWSSFAGVGGETVIVVRGNQVTERRYQEFASPQAPVAGAKPAGWTEKGDDIGSHKQGAAAKTLDELYEEAAKIVKAELAPHEKRYVRLNEDGLLLACFSVDTRIADDAPIQGVRITSIELAGKVYKAPNGKPFPAHWGAPPRIQTRDLRPLPGDYGRGSGTLAKWIQMNLDRDAKAPKN